eukprot:2555239-Amphidinium_carterae.1
MPNIRPGAALLDMGGNESFMTDETLHSGVASVVTWDLTVCKTHTVTATKIAAEQIQATTEPNQKPLATTRGK